MFKLSLRVDYADTDAMGIVHHASYLRYLERTRVEWLRSLGLPYSRMEAEGYYLPVAGVELKYERSLRFDEVAEVRMRVRERSRVQIRLDYEVFRGSERIAVAMTHHALCKRVEEGGQVKWTPARIPKDWEALIDAAT